jgi:DNA (cytosine-5)-methyltransferase 1
MVKFIDLFSGIGGFRLALEELGCNCVFSSEIDKFARQTYSKNFGSEPFGDIKEISEKSIPEHNVLVAGFPCPAFSIAGVSKNNSLGRKHGLDHKQGDLFFEILRVLKHSRPNAFLLENVDHLRTYERGTIWEVMKKELISLGYSVFTKIIDANLVVPQRRKRIFIVGLRDSSEFIFPKIEEKEIRLTDILENHVDDEFNLNDATWAYLQKHKALHEAKGNGFGYSFANPDTRATRTLTARYGKDGSEILIEQKGKNPRMLTPRECARLMGFPDDFEIPVSKTQAYKQFGNAVVPEVAKRILKSILLSIRNSSDTRIPYTPLTNNSEVGGSMYTNYQGYGEWDFRNEDTKEFTHCFHIYPAMMIPQVARGLIKLYGKKGDVLFDPYCGSGTSLVEGRLAGMNVFGTDLNPTARLIARAKVITYNLEELKLDISVFTNNLQEELQSVSSLDEFDAPENVTFERLQDWFPIKSIAEVSHCINKASKIKNYDNENFILLALSECLRLVSFQRNGEFKLYRIKSEQRPSHYLELHKLLIKRLERNLEGFERYLQIVQNDAKNVGVFDFNTVITNGLEFMETKPNIVVTSPPYGDSGTTVAYAQFSWLTNVWLGLDKQAPGALDRSLMGGRKEEVEEFGFKPMDDALSQVFEQDEKRAKEVMHFYREYRDSMINVASIVESGGHVCYVVGNRTVKGTQLPTDQFTAWVFENSGFEYVATYLRDIPNKRMPSKNSPTNKAGKKVSTMHKEYLVVLKKI